MKAIIIGAGRGIRLMPTTENSPKCFAEVGGRRILDWMVRAFAECGVQSICFVGGYQIEIVRRDYPQFTFFHNREWQDNNILTSLMCAEEEMNGPFICCYSDILFKPEIIKALLTDENDIALAVDTEWQIRYRTRTEHPTDDAEKVTVKNHRVTRIHREIPDSEAYGEFAGVAGFSTEGAGQLKEHYHRCMNEYAGRPFREAPVFRKAYLIHLFQEMIEAGVKFTHVDTRVAYMEIDTQQDYEPASKIWR